MKNLARAAASAAFWNVAYGITREALKFVVMIALVRLLTPADYGQYGLANAIMAFAFVFSARSILAYGIQERRDEDVHWSDYFAFGALIELSLFMIVNCVAIGMRAFPAYQAVAPLVHVLSVLFITTWPKELCVTILQRELNWRRFRTILIVGAVFSSAMSIALAVAGAGPYALAVPAVLLPLVFWQELFVVRAWRPRRTWSWKKLIPAIRFGLSRLSSAVLSGGQLLVESTFLSAALGFAGFGIYGRAVGLATLACGQFVELLTQALYPALTKVEPSTDRMRRATSNLLRVVLWMVIPLAFSLIRLAEDLVVLVYGQQWREVIPLMIACSALAALGAVQKSIYLTLLANDHRRLCVSVDGALAVCTLINLFVFLPSGAIAYIWAMAALYLFMAASLLIIGRLARILWLRPFVTAAVVAGVAAFAADFLGSQLYGVLKTGDGLLFRILAIATYLAAFSVSYVVGLRVLAASDLKHACEHLPILRKVSRVLLLS